MSNEIDNRLGVIESHKEKHETLGSAVLRANDGSLFSLDFLVIAAINRSIANGEALCNLSRTKNYISAASILRLQLDSCLRIYASSLVSNPHEFAQEVFSGASVRDLKDKDGKRMFDAYLVKKMSNQHTWIPTVYERSSGFIHLSNKHIFTSMELEGDSGEGSIYIGIKPDIVPIEYWVELLDCYIETTNILCQLIEQWQNQKARIE